MTSSTVGLVGLGRMGVPIAEKLLAAGHAVVGCRRGRSDELEALGGTVAGSGTCREVAERCQVVLTCLPSEAALDAVVSGPGGLLESDRPGLVVVELSTLGVEAKRRQLAALEALDGTMLDCPVSGTPVMVRESRASVFAGGDRQAYERVAPLLEAFAGRVNYVGEFGTATQVKFLASVLVAVHTAAAAEVVALARTAGLDAASVVDVLKSSPATTSGMLAVRAPMMAAGRFPRPALGPVDLLRKDLAYVWDFVRDVGAVTPLLDAASRIYEQAAVTGKGGEDIACVVELLLTAARRPAAPSQ